jgi:Spy/CpxP family protein refolding chaperone
MMGDGGPGWGRGGGGFGALNLTDEQREKIAVAQEKSRSRNWETMGQLRSEQFKLRQMAYSDRIEPAAYTEQQKKVDELRRNMLRARIESRNEIDAILTPEQRKQFRQFGPWWLQNGNVE